MKYEPCAGSGKPATDPHTVNTTDLGSRFAHMRGKVYGTCPSCDRSGLVLIRDHWLRDTPASITPRHKATEETA